MNRNLLTPISTLFTSPFSKSFGSLLTLVLVLNFGITSKINAQCVGPYQVFESFGVTASRATMIGNGWGFSAAAATPATSAANSRSGSNFLNMGTVLGVNVTTPVIVNPSIFQFYHRSTLTTRDVVFKVEWLTSDLSTVLGSASGTTTTNIYSAYSVNLSAYTNIRVRITYDAVSGASGTPGLQLDDISWTSTVASQNTIVVPERGNTTCSSVIVPAAGTGVLKFYDQGGLSDRYNASSTQVVVFQPAIASEKVRLTFVNSFALEATANITVCAKIPGIKYSR